MSASFRMIVAAALLLLPTGACAEQSDTDARVAALVAAAGHVDSVFARIPMAPVGPDKLRMAPGKLNDPNLVQRVAQALGVQVRPMEAVIRCDAMLRCQSTDGSRAGFRFLESQFGTSRATVVMETWIFEREGHLYGQVDRLHLVRSGGEWKIAHVERLAET